MTLTCQGGSQHHLVHRVAAEQELVGCVWMTAAPPSGNSRLRKVARRLADPLRLMRHMTARNANHRAEAEIAQLNDQLFRVPDDSLLHSPDLPQRFVHDINDPAAVDFVRSLNPDVVLVNGTNLLRTPWHSWADQISHGIINIHTGLSPYSRGGNCNLFSILHGQLQCVGVTVHYIDSGIDSGDIIYTDRPAIRPGDSFEAIESRVFRLGEDLAALALRQLAAGQTLPREKQWTTGREFLKRTGYVYSPWQRVLANRRLRQQGLIEIYLTFRDQMNASARIITPSVPPALWRHPAV